MFNHLQVKVKSFQEPIFIFVFFAFSAASAFLYRLGSARIDKGLPPGMRDLGTYLDAGRSIMNGRNPYLNPQVRTGPMGSALIGLIDKGLSDYAFSWLALLSVPIGLALFAYVNIQSDLDRHRILPWLLLIPWLSATRENLVNIQITGIILMFFSFGILLHRMNKFRSLPIVGALLIAFAVDMKPHLLLIFFLIEFLRKRNISTVSWTLLFVFSGHLLTSLYTREFLTLEWFKTLTGLNASASNAQLPESIAIWPILTKIGVNPHLTSLISVSLIVVLTFVLVFNALKNAQIDNRIASLIVPSFGFFFHFYDLAPVVVFVFFAFLAKNRARLISLFVGIFLIPENFQDSTSLVLLGMMIFYSQVLVSPRNLKLVIFGMLQSLVIWFTYACTVSIFANHFGRHAIAMTLTIIILIALSITDLMYQRRSLHAPM